MRIRRRKKKIAASPGTLVHTGEQRTEAVRIRVIDYEADRLEEREVHDISECTPLRDSPSVSWINIDGLHRVDIIEDLGRQFQIHPLVLEDVLHTSQRPKFEDHGDHIFIVLRMLTHGQEMEDEQLALILGPNYLLSFQEREGDFFEPVRERIRSGHGRIRQMQPDYLAYALMDAIIDNTMSVAEILEERVENLGTQLMSTANPEDGQLIFETKTQVQLLRRATAPLRELVRALLKSESALIHKATTPYLRDLQDHAVRTLESVEHLRVLSNGLFDLHLATLNQRMNEVIKVLTVIATIFIPLTFIAGIYGMNFEYIPELRWRWGYPAVLLIMFGLLMTMLFHFKRKKWF